MAKCVAAQWTSSKSWCDWLAGILFNQKYLKTFGLRLISPLTFFCLNLCPFCCLHSVILSYRQTCLLFWRVSIPKADSIKFDRVETRTSGFCSRVVEKNTSQVVCIGSNANHSDEECSAALSDTDHQWLPSLIQITDDCPLWHRSPMTALSDTDHQWLPSLTQITDDCLSDTDHQWLAENCVVPLPSPQTSRLLLPSLH